jgi:hypothetical protein
VSGGVAEPAGSDGGLVAGDEDADGESASGGEPLVAGDPVGVTVPQPTSRPMSGTTATSANGPRVALGRAQERLSIGQG